MERCGYRKKKCIGKGSFGQALLVENLATGGLCVAKEIYIDKLNDKEKELCQNEIKVLKQLNHPNVIKFLDHFTVDNLLYIVTEYAESGDLSRLLKQHRLCEDDIIYYFIQICLALQHVHSCNIVHRDIKCQNVFLSDSRRFVKLGDFGISTVLQNSIEFARTQCGTPFYFSPEVCNNEPYDSKSDVWSLGCLLYEMCTGTTPFSYNNNLSALMLAICRGDYKPLPAQFSKGTRELLSKLLQVDPKDRPSVSEIIKLEFINKRIVTMCANVHRTGKHHLPSEERRANEEKKPDNDIDKRPRQHRPAYPYGVPIAQFMQFAPSFEQVMQKPKPAPYQNMFSPYGITPHLGRGYGGHNPYAAKDTPMLHYGDLGRGWMPYDANAKPQFFQPSLPHHPYNYRREEPSRAPPPPIAKPIEVNSNPPPKYAPKDLKDDPSKVRKKKEGGGPTLETLVKGEPKAMREKETPRMPIQETWKDANQDDDRGYDEMIKEMRELLSIDRKEKLQQYMKNQ